LSYILLTNFGSEAFWPLRQSQRFFVVRERKKLYCPQHLVEIRGSFLPEERAGRERRKKCIRLRRQ